MFKKEKWIAIKSDDDLVSYINTNGWELKNPAEYQLKTQEMEYAKEIICLFKKTNMKNFFCEDRVSLSQKKKEIYKLRNIDYFMFSLLCYMEDYVGYDSYLFRDKIYEDRKYSDSSHFSCQLTNYGRVCYKIYLVASVYCENNDYTKPLIIQSQSNHIIKYLQKNKIEFWTYRP